MNSKYATKIIKYYLTNIQLKFDDYKSNPLQLQNLK